LRPSELAALVSVFTFEARGPGAVAPGFPTQPLRERWARIDRLASELNDAEDDAGLPMTRRPDPGFAALAFAWAAGNELAAIIADEEISGGDFVRNVKQLIDLLRQLAEIAPAEEIRRAARTASDRLFRGVVAASSIISAGEDEAEDDQQLAPATSRVGSG
jgi:ATP-dependent RNA helicase HelY